MLVVVEICIWSLAYGFLGQAFSDVYFGPLVTALLAGALQ
jgi:hypothetical protein